MQFSVQQVPYKGGQHYGFNDSVNMNARLMQVSKFVEKPALEDAPLNFAIIGR